MTKRERFRGLRLSAQVLTGALAIASLVAACRGLPSVTFEDDAGAAGDATVHTEDAASRADGGDASLEDAGDDGSDDAGPTQGEDAAVPEGGIACGDAGGVPSCAQCPGAPLRCTKGSQDECVADCTSCAAAAYPCWHCPGNGGAPRGDCLAVAGTGALGCSAGSACACDAATDCPGGGGGSQVCLLDASAKGGRCATCGQASTNGDPCTLDDGGEGTCNAGTATPTCE